MIRREQQFDKFTHGISRRGFIKAGALGLWLLVSKLQTPSRVSAEPSGLDPEFDIKLDPNQSYTTPESHFLTVKGDVLVDGVDVKNSDDPIVGTLGRTYKTRVAIVAPHGANIHGNIGRCESDAYYRDSITEMREKGCLSGCDDLREWHRGDPESDVCQPTAVITTPVATSVPVVEPTVSRVVCVTESPLKPGQELPAEPIDYDVCSGATVFVPRQSAIQGDAEPVENGTPRETWHDSETNTGLITITGRDGYWRFVWGGDVYYDPDPSRLMQYAQDMAVLMKNKGCGTGIGCPEGVSILRWPEDRGQGE